MSRNLSLYENKLQFYLVCSDESELSSDMEVACEVCYSFVGAIFVVEIFKWKFGCEYTTC